MTCAATVGKTAADVVSGKGVENPTEVGASVGGLLMLLKVRLKQLVHIFQHHRLYLLRNLRHYRAARSRVHVEDGR